MPKKKAKAKKKTTAGHDAALRKQLLELLNGGNAHADFDAAVRNLPAAALRGKRPKGAEHSPWEVLEHLRIAQWDILEFSRNTKHKSPDWPSGYWPKTAAPPDDKAWDKSVRAFRRDLKAMCDLVAEKSTDLFAPIPHGDGQTILREALLLADHNAYHLGELVLVRRLLGAWR
jgi:DinB superfamily